MYECFICKNNPRHLFEKSSDLLSHLRTRHFMLGELKFPFECKYNCSFLGKFHDLITFQRHLKKFHDNKTSFSGNLLQTNDKNKVNEGYNFINGAADREKSIYNESGLEFFETCSESNVEINEQIILDELRKKFLLK